MPTRVLGAKLLAERPRATRVCLLGVSRCGIHSTIRVADLGTAWKTFGAWSGRAGKQYAGDDSAFGGVKVDLDTFNPLIFSGGTWGMALDQKRTRILAAISGLSKWIPPESRNEPVCSDCYHYQHKQQLYTRSEISLAFDALSTNATPVGTTDVTTCTYPAGSFFVNVSLGTSAALSPRQSATVTVTFTNPTNQAIT